MHLLTYGAFYIDKAQANAVKFTEEGDVELVVLSCEFLNADTVLLAFEVRDTGIGVAPEHVSELFSLFSQLDGSSTRKYEGSGLGMSSGLLVFRVHLGHQDCTLRSGL